MKPILRLVFWLAVVSQGVDAQVSRAGLAGQFFDLLSAERSGKFEYSRTNEFYPYPKSFSVPSLSGELTARLGISLGDLRESYHYSAGLSAVASLTKTGFSHWSGDRSLHRVRSEPVVNDRVRQQFDLRSTHNTDEYLVTEDEFVRCRSTIDVRDSDGAAQRRRATAVRRPLERFRSMEARSIPTQSYRSLLALLFHPGPVDAEVLFREEKISWRRAERDFLPLEVLLAPIALLDAFEVEARRREGSIEIRLQQFGKRLLLLGETRWIFKMSREKVTDFQRHISTIYFPSGERAFVRDIVVHSIASVGLPPRAEGYETLVPLGADVEDRRFSPSVSYQKVANMRDQDIVGLIARRDQAGVAQAAIDFDGMNDRVSREVDQRAIESQATSNRSRDDSEFEWWKIGLLSILALFGGGLVVKRIVCRSFFLGLFAVALVSCGDRGGTEPIPRANDTLRIQLSSGEVGEPLHLGRLLRGGAGESTVNLCNDSDSEIRIQELRSDCSCMVLGATEFVIAPGATATARVTMDTSLPGTRGVTLEARINGSDRHRLIGNLKYEVVWGVRPIPAALKWAPDLEQACQLVVRLVADGTSSMKVAEFGVPCLKLTAQLQVMDNLNTKAVFDFDASLPFGDYAVMGRGVARIDGDPFFRFSVPVQITRDCPFVEIEPRVNIGLLSRSKELVRTIAIGRPLGSWVPLSVSVLSPQEHPNIECSIVNGALELRACRFEQKAVVRSALLNIRFANGDGGTASHMLTVVYAG